MSTFDGNSTNYLNDLYDKITNQFKENNVSSEFTDKIRKEDIVADECSFRVDFCSENVFTIDCESTKDMDDAISIAKTTEGYQLSVHIADVSAYVPFGSPLDNIAISRGNSIYLPILTVPMLPEILTNDLCSLNPNVIRNTLSVIINLSERGDVISSKIVKGKIRSKVKGVYSEVNRILAGEKDEYLSQKYHDVYTDLFDMETLYEVLRYNSTKRGATLNDSNRPIISVEESDITITPHRDGVAENMIEEFMIIANRVVAEFLFEHDLPAIFRIQGKKNNMAAYSPVKTHHADLALESYSHFTSPIRRVADLKIHQIISMYLNGISAKEIHELFDSQLIDVCERATKRSRTAKQIERHCEQYCYRQYFLRHSNNRYKGSIVGFDKRNRPIIKINSYNIRIIGYEIINGKIGKNYSFEVKVSSTKNELFTAKATAVA